METGVEIGPLDLTGKIRVLPQDTESVPFDRVAGDVRGIRLGKAGGAQVIFAHAQDAAFIPEEFCDRSGYVIVLLLSGEALINMEYVEAPQLAVIPPGREMPELYGDAQVLIVSLGPVDQLNTESRLRVSLADALPFDFSLGSMLTSSVGKCVDCIEAQPAPDLRWSIRSRGKDPGDPHPHHHPSGGEIMLVLSGGIRDRGWDLKPFDLVVYGPKTSHGPAYDRNGGMVLTVSPGLYA